MSLRRWRCHQPGCTHRAFTFGALMRHVLRCPHNVLYTNKEQA